MEKNAHLAALTKEELIGLAEIYAKNWLAMDGVWFQSVERKFGMDEAMFHDEEIWRRFTVIEAKRIKEFLHLEERPGLEGLAKALRYRFYGCINDDSYEFFTEDGKAAEGSGDSKESVRKLIYTMVDCRVQTARKRRGLGFHPCRSVGIIEYSGFAREIDDRIHTRCLSCYPEITDTSCCCKWEFFILKGV